MCKIVMCLLVVFLITSLSVSLAETYTTKTGPFTIQVESNESVEFTPEGSFPIDNFNVYDIGMTIEGNPRLYDIEISDYGQATDISSLPLMEAVEKYWGTVTSEFITSWNVLEVGGKPGLTASIEKEDVAKTGLNVHPTYIAVYSPDGFGNRGSVIAVVVANAKEETFKENKKAFEDIVKNLRISRES